jgi:leukotriene-A4 hydrolase
LISNISFSLKGVDPDDAFSSVPYEKGFNFLYYLTTLVGGFNVFEQFLYSYFLQVHFFFVNVKFKFKCVTSEDFKTYFMNYFDQKIEVDWNAWFYTTGMPPVKNEFDDSLSMKSMDLAERWTSNFENESFHEDDLKNWSTIEICLLN